VRLVPAAEERRPGAAWRIFLPDDPPGRPLRLFTPPQPVETLAEVPDGPPLRFRWRRVLHEVARAEGPERIAPEWWQDGPDEPTRDYFRVEDAEGHRFWRFRAGLYGRETERPRWYLHGLFA
jgi:protein ImuB